MNLSIDIPKSFAKGMRPVVSFPFEADCMTPAFNESVEGICFNWPPKTREENFCVHTVFNEGLDSLNTKSVQVDPADLFGFLFSKGQDIHRLHVPDLADCEINKVDCPEVGVNTEDKNSVVSGVIFQKVLNLLNFFKGRDRINSDDRPFFGVVMISSFSHGVALL